jgi:hypothetical protein
MGKALSTMKKFLLFAIVLSGTIFSGFAQTKSISELSIGGEFGIPVGEVSHFYGTVAGASLKLEIPVSVKSLSVTLTGGLSEFLDGLDYNGPVKSSLFAPLELGGKYYFSKIAYVEGDAGISYDINGNYASSKTAFIYSPIIGITAPRFKHKSTIDIGLRYESRVESGALVGQIALRLAYRFGL